MPRPPRYKPLSKRKNVDKKKQTTLDLHMVSSPARSLTGSTFEILVPRLPRAQSETYERLSDEYGEPKATSKLTPTTSKRKLGPRQTALNAESFAKRAGAERTVYKLSSDDDPSEPIASTKKARRKLESSDDGSFRLEEEEESDKTAVISSRILRGNRMSVRLRSDDQSGDSTPELTTTPVPSRIPKLQSTASRRKQILVIDGDDDDSDYEVRNIRRKKQKVEESEGIAPLPAFTATPKSRLTAATVLVESPPKKKKQEYIDKTRIRLGEDSDAGINCAEPREGVLVKHRKATSYNNESLEEDLPLFFSASQTTNSSTGKESTPDAAARQAPQRLPFSQSPESSEAGGMAPTRRKDKGKGKATSPTLDLGDGTEDEDDPLPVITPGRRQRQKRQRTLSSGSIELPEQSPKATLDLSDSDLEIVSEKRILSSRTRYGSSPKKLSNYQKGLKKLNARRRQLSSPIVDNEVEMEQYLSLSASGENNSEPLEGLTYDDIASPTGTASGSEDSFIVDDYDESLLGIPPSEDIAPNSSRAPIQFTSQSYQDLKTHFKTLIQWMVNTFLYPAFPRNDEYFKNAFHSLDRRMDNFRDSFVSSAWKGIFFTTLKKRPKMAWSHTGARVGQHCVACNNRERDAVYIAWFTGKLYDPQTLQDNHPEDDDESEDDSTDEYGNEIAPENERFPLGRFCFERAEITHSIWHWKKTQYSEVEEALRKLGCFSEEAESRADGMDDGEKLRWANEILTVLEERGDVEVWYGMFKKLGDAATEFVSSNGRRRY